MKKTIIALTFICACGCSIYRSPVPSGDYYYLHPDADMSEVGKVVLIELQNKSSYPQISMDVTNALFEEIQKKSYFSVRVVHENDPALRSLAMDFDSVNDPAKYLAVAKTLQCDAVIVGQVIEYTPFPHLSLGLRMRMIKCIDGELIWAYEQVWDTADKKTIYRIKKYQETQSCKGSEKVEEQLITVSSIKFVKFVAYEVASTF